MSNSREFTCQGIVLRVIKYKENHAMVRFLTPEYGAIQCSVRGLSNKKNSLAGTISNLNYLDLELSQSSNSDIYLIKNAQLISSLANVQNYDCFKYQSAGVELFTKIDNYLEEDFVKLFQLLLSYLTYLPTIKKNQIAIFWRFVIHYFYILGIALNLNECPECQQKFSGTFTYSLDYNAFLCTSCALQHKTKHISLNAQQILKELPTIGNIIESIDIEEETKKEINEILLSHLSHSLHKDFILKSISL
jgi:DNA repair protein RecO